MADRSAETPLLAYARVAGLLSLIIIACGIFSEAVVRSGLVMAGDAAATAANISAARPLFRIGFAADAVMLLSDVAVAVLLYVLLRPVDRTLALMAAAFRLTQTAILGSNLLNYYAVLLVLNEGQYMAPFETGELNALAMLFLDMHSHGYDLGLLFFGVSNFILGYLVVRSGYLPSLLGHGLLAAAAVYVAGSFIRFLFPAFVSFAEPLYVIPFISELSFGLWLLVKGLRFEPAPASG